MSNVTNMTLSNSELLSQVSAWTTISLILIFVVIALLFWLFFGRRIKESLDIQIRKGRYEVMKEKYESISPVIDQCKKQISLLTEENDVLKTKNKELVLLQKHTQELQNKDALLEQQNKEILLLQKKYNLDLHNIKAGINQIVSLVRMLPEEKNDPPPESTDEDNPFYDDKY